VPPKDTGCIARKRGPRILRGVAKKPTPPAEEPISRAERLVAIWFITILALSIAAIFALFIAGSNAKGNFWAIIQILPLIGLPISFIMIIIMLVIGTRRRSRAAKGAGK
jgi:hypothetical protein